MALGEPGPQAYFFPIVTADGSEYDAFWDVVAFDGFYDSQVRYRLKGQDNDAWAYLSASNNEGDQKTEVNEQALLTTEGANNDWLRLMAVHNEAITKAFGGGAGEIPENGLERLRHLIEHNTVAIDNQLQPKN